MSCMMKLYTSLEHFKGTKAMTRGHGHDGGNCLTGLPHNTNLYLHRYPGVEKEKKSGVVKKTSDTVGFKPLFLSLPVSLSLSLSLSLVDRGRNHVEARPSLSIQTYDSVTYETVSRLNPFHTGV